jgi:hypothetical protein
MKHHVTLLITSVLSTVLFALHWCDEISRGLEPGTLQGAGGLAILVVWLCGPLLLGERRSGYVVMLVGGILGLAVVLLHMSGRGMVGGRIANTSGIYFWVVTLIALSMTASMSAILAGYGLVRWKRREGLHHIEGR